MSVEQSLRGLCGCRATETGPTALPEVQDTVRQVKSGEDRVGRYLTSAAAVGLHVQPVTRSNWVDAIRTILRGPEVRARSRASGAPTEPEAPARGRTTNVLICAQGDSALTDERASELAAGLRSDGIQVHTTPTDELLFSVDASITGVSAAIAETGTIVCPSGPGLARGASLIPPVHIAIVSAEQIVPDLYDLLVRIGSGAELPTNLNLITGPSKTADIEGILITGVHGPGDVYVLVLSD